MIATMTPQVRVRPRSPARSSPTVGPALFAAVLLLSGCTGPSNAFPAFDVPQEAKDEVTANDAVLDSFDPSSSRFAGEYEDSDLYIARPKGGQGICIIVLGTEPSGEYSGCSVSGDWVSVSLGSAEVSTAGAPGTEDWTAPLRLTRHP